MDINRSTLVGSEAPEDSSFEELLRMGVDTTPPVVARGTVLDETYRIDEEIGRGGMGRVYRAHDVKLERDVAIKIHGVHAIDGQKWSLREATALAKLSHPNVVTVYGVGAWLGHPWVAMEYVPGGTARTWAHVATRTPREIVALLVGAGHGIVAAHAAGIVHRDFKPDNVLVSEDGQPRVADFGLALHLAKADGNATLLVGTPAYMAPEQWNRVVAGKPADQFAFAVSLWELLVGERPYRGANEAEIRAAWKLPLAAPSKPMPRHVEAALRRALAIDPDARWPEMQPLLDELARDPRRTRRRFAAAAIAGIALAGGGALVASMRSGSSVPAEPPCAHATDGFATAEKLRSELPALAGDLATPKLDAWMTAWRTNRVRACEDTHVRRTQPLAVLELRELCFEKARTALEVSLVDLPKAKDRFPLVEGLPRLADCDNVTRMRNVAPLPADPVARAEITDIEKGLATARENHLAGRVDDAYALAEKLLARSRKTERKALISQAELQFGVLQSAKQKFEEARLLYEDAAKLAAEAGDDFGVAKAWALVVDVLSARLQQPLEAEKMVPVAEAAALRVGNAGEIRADLLATLADLDFRQGRLDKARDRLQQAIELHATEIGEDSELARLLNMLAFITMRLDDPAASRKHLQRAAELLERTYGPGYRNLPMVWGTLAQLEFRTGNYAESRRVFERAVARLEEINGKDSPALVTTLTYLGAAVKETGDPVLAEQHLARAETIARKEFGEGHAKTIDAMRWRAKLPLEAKDWKLAEKRLLVILPLQRKLGTIAPLDSLELDLAEVYLHTKRYGDARAAVDRARVVSQQEGGDVYMQSKVLEMEGRVHRAQGNEAKAMDAFKRSLATLEAKLGPTHPDTLALRKLIEGKPE